MNRTSKAIYIALAITLGILGVLWLGQSFYIDYYYTHYETESNLSGFLIPPQTEEMHIFEGYGSYRAPDELVLSQGGEETTFLIDGELNCIPPAQSEIKIVAYYSHTWISGNWHVKRIVSGC